jgi:histidine triad (HIT) family protein
MPPVDCIFCKIVNGEIPSKKLYEDDSVVAFNDINPAAPVHYLVIPKAHLPTLDDATEAHQALLGKMLLVAANLAREQGIETNGYRQVINCREHGGQVVYHLHLHVLGGRQMQSLG